MKIMFIADVHGCYDKFKKAYDFFVHENIDQLYVLGDLFTSAFCGSVDDMQISKLLQLLIGKVHFVRGNCDSDYTNELLPEYMKLSHTGFIGNRKFICFHGHQFLPIDSSLSFVIKGHTHHFKMEKVGSIYDLNPGSIGRSRDYSGGSFLIICDNLMTIYDLNYQILKEEKII